MRLRDRDSPVTEEGLLFRVYGYNHPPGAWVCDLEYAHESVYVSRDPRAIREGRAGRFYKFYFDGGLRFVRERFPQYQVYYKPLRRRLVGVSEDQIHEVRRPDEALRRLYESDRDDPLVETMRELLDTVVEHSGLRLGDFGVFGSLLHDFYNPRYSDIDLTVYGIRETRRLVETLRELYRDPGTRLRNEFEGWRPEEHPMTWRFLRYSKAEYGWYQRRKMIYGVYDSERLGRTVKVEFEPVRRWEEITNEYSDDLEITNLGFTECVVEVLDDSESMFMPSVYHVEALEGPDVDRVVSYVEEFRGQLKAGERGVVCGWLEEHRTPRASLRQVTLTYGPRYFEQCLKLASGSDRVKLSFSELGLGGDDEQPRGEDSGT